MDREQIKEVIRDVFGHATEVKDLGNWVSLKCPLAPWTHEKGTDTTASAGVSVAPDGTSIYNCFTCKNPRPFHAMLRDYAEFSGDNLDEIIEELEEGEFLGPSRPPTYDEMRQRASEDSYAMPIDEGLYMDLYEPVGRLPYLRERGIDQATARKLELRFDPCDSEKEPRILFPVRGEDGLLYGFSGRAIYPDARLKVRDYHGLHKAEMVLGAHLVGARDKVLVVEGLFDYANAHQCGYTGCAVMHSTMTERQAEIFRNFGNPTYLFYDDDKAGQQGVDKAKRMLSRYMPLFSVTYPDIWIEDDSPEGGHWLKDPGEMLPEDFEDMIKKARLL